MVQLEEMQRAALNTCCVPLQHTDASITQIALTNVFPPRLVATGYTKGIKGWQGFEAEGGGPTGFRPMLDFSPEAKQVRITLVAIHGPFLIAADNAAYGTLTIFETKNWTELIKLQVSERDGPEEGTVDLSVAASVASMVFDGTYIAVGTNQGEIKVWKQPRQGVPFTRLLTLRVDKLPVSTLLMSEGLVCGFSASKQTLVVWRLEDGKLQHAWTADQVSGGRPLVHACMKGNVVASLHQHPTPEAAAATAEENATHPTVQLVSPSAGFQGGSSCCPVAVVNRQQGNAERRCECMLDQTVPHLLA
ncbi:hypothetical protein CYMTET_24634, partial [Cymbomonas tetramitiformis]